MYSIAHVLAYFLNGKGHWPEYIDWFFASARANSTVDFYIFTDDHSIDKWNEAPNINIVHMSFDECIDRIHKNVGEDVNIKTTRKLCDMKTVYCKIFNEWVKDYDFWAFGDCDLLLGDIRKVFTDELLDKYDRFQILGNFQIIRNTEEINNNYLLKRPENSRRKDFTWDYVKSVSKNQGFDEGDGLPLLAKENGVRIYWTRENFANIYQDYKYKKMLDNTVQENRLFQYWKWENGKIYHVDKLTGRKKERLYIHFSNRKMKNLPYTGQSEVYMTVNSEFKDHIEWKDTFCGMDFFKVYAKKIVIYIKWHLDHAFGRNKD